jgi:3-methyladenine DNA glycosylase AlkD
MSDLKMVIREIRSIASPKRAKVNAWFFKTGSGHYGEGDKFLGLTVPALRAVAKRHRDLGQPDIIKLLQSPWHEERMLALLILVDQHKRGNSRAGSALHQLYLKNLRQVNNWDLVDLSAEELIGAELAGRNLKLLQKLARSKNLWERRIAVVATFYDIKRGNSERTFIVARQLLKDEQDLIHKATGWMLREVGKRCSRQELKVFLKQHATEMPRTMLRYSIEHFPERQRKAYLAKR